MLRRVDIASGGNRNQRPVRVIVSGCGAVTRRYAAPALARLAERGLIKTVAAFDPDDSAVRAACEQLPGTAATASFEELLAAGADLAVIAAPPRFHAEQTIAALAAGLDVLCEKPMATRLADADRMLAAAADAGRILAVGLVRRHVPAARAIRALLHAEAIGRLISVTWFEGGPFEWPVSSPAYFSSAESGGGVLQDVGTHVLDLLSWWLGPPFLVAYEDDAMGGVEANCGITLEIAGADVRVRLSRDWGRPNRVVLRGDCGAITWAIRDIATIDLDLPGGLCGTLSLSGNPAEPPDFVECYARQLVDMVEAIGAGRAPVAPGMAGREALLLVETCYVARRLMEMPWLSGAERARAASLAEPAR